MKKWGLLAVAVVLLASVAAFAGSSTTVTGWVSDSMCGAKHMSAGGEGCVKKCVDGGSKLVIVNDKDKSVWTVENPETLKGHEGHHVSVTGTLNADNKTINVTEVKVLAMGKDKDKKEEHQH